MRNDILNKFLNYGRDNDSIISIFYNKSDNDKEFINIYTVVNEVIIGKLEEEIKYLFDDIILVNRKKNSFEFEKKVSNYTTISIYKADSVKISESIISKDLYEEFIKTLKNDIEYIYTSEDSIAPLVNKDFKYDLPKEYEFVSCVNNFFSNCIEVSFYINQKDSIAASIKMEDVRSELYKMINFHIIDKFYGLKNIGVDGRNLKHTLTKDLRDDLNLCFNTDDLLDIYNCLFRACVLFRKIGMHEAKNLGLSYDREADVKTMRLLRDNYKKLESFIR